MGGPSHAVRMLAFWAGVALLLPGCTFFDGIGSDDSRLIVNRNCSVELNQGAFVDGADSAINTEKVTIDNGCNVIVDFKQEIKDDKLK